QITTPPTSYFYPRSHVGNDADNANLIEVVEVFLSTFPRRERLDKNKAWIRAVAFLSTFPRRERLNSASSIVSMSIFLSTFPRRERLNYNGEDVHIDKISIHVPT